VRPVDAVLINGDVLPVAPAAAVPRRAGGDGDVVILGFIVASSGIARCEIDTVYSRREGKRRVLRGAKLRPSYSSGSVFPLPRGRGIGRGVSECDRKRCIPGTWSEVREVCYRGCSYCDIAIPG